MKKCILILLVSFLFSPLSILANDTKLVSSTQNGIIFEYIPKYLSENHFKDEKGRILPLFEDASAPDFKNVGQIDYRYKSIPIALPTFTGNTFTILETEFEDIQGVRIKPITNLVIENNFLVPDYSNEPEFFNQFENEIVKWGEIGVIRNIIVGQLQVYPYKQINSNVVRIYKKIKIQVNFGEPIVELKSRGSDDYSYRGVINEEQAKTWHYEIQNPLLMKVTNSKFRSGNWYRIKITEEGIYKLDFNYLKSKGIDLSSVDPRTIQIFGNGGKLLSERPEDFDNVDLIENSILVVGEEDGKFDQSDYIIFYAPAVKGWEFNNSTKRIEHYYHHYSDVNYVWLTFGQATGKRMKQKISITNQPDSIVSTTIGYVLNREFKKNLASTGRRWFGDEFNDRSKTRVYNNRLPGLIPNQQIIYRISVAARSDRVTTFLIDENNNRIGSISLLPVNLADGIGFYASMNYGVFTFSSNLTDQRSLLKFTYNITDAISSGYLEYFEILYPRYLQPENDKIWFFSPQKSGTFEYLVSNFSNSDIRVFDVTNFDDVKIISNANISGMQIRFRASENAQSPSKYFAVGANGYLVPSEVIKISNQNLRGISPGAELIIISPKEFLPEANRLKAHKESRRYKPISTAVINVDEIYNEFSGGLLDVSAIRNFIKYAYTYWTVKPKYVLLFGDGHYDYRNIEGYGKNFIPPYETEESLLLIYSYPTDDFYGRIIGNDTYVDIAVGRLNIQSIQEAKAIVDKIIRYETNKDFGQWRNLITLVADDGKTTKGDDGDVHTYQSEALAKNTIPGSFSQKKIYLIQYPTTETAGGRRKPDVNREIINAFNNGTLIMNFIGHGNPEVWTHEYVFEKTLTLPQLKNSNRLPFLSAATCDFGDYDKPANQSSMEMLVNKSDGGVIAGFTASRAVWSDQNFAINYKLFEALLSYRKTNSEQPTLGDAYFETKKFKNSDNDQKYHLFGDPSIYLLAPKEIGRIDSINNLSTLSLVNIKALGKTTIVGSIREANGNLKNDFNGEALITVYDSKRYQEIPEWYGWTGPGRGIELDGGIIYRGRASVRNGVFRTEFVVPKDVSYEQNNGKISIYFYDNNTDGSGFTENIKIVSSDSISVVDNSGPDIKIFFDNDQSYGASLVTTNPLLIVKLSDETGINTTGLGIGHNIEAILNDDPMKSIKLNEYFQGDLDQGNRKGEVRYRLSDLPNGKNKIKVIAWDVFNNKNEAEMDFEVFQQNQFVIKHIYNFPNPMKDETVFTFQHNIDQPVNVVIKIYSVSGRLIHKIEKQNVIEKFVKISWDGRDNEGDFLANGVYLYKIIINSLDNTKSSEALGKLAIIR
ncbi:MAG: type IX secretion system sortase PorU [Ignavibacteria bacterium]|nr:type IX secretion system sortase PorU [Ignavibacteria bacterium]